jgi:hypothetical protein
MHINIIFLTQAIEYLKSIIRIKNNYLIYDNSIN